MDQQAVQERRRRGLNIAEVAFYSVLILVIMLLSSTFQPEGQRVARLRTQPATPVKPFPHFQIQSRWRGSERAANNHLAAIRRPMVRRSRSSVGSCGRHSKPPSKGTGEDVDGARAGLDARRAGRGSPGLPRDPGADLPQGWQEITNDGPQAWRDMMKQPSQRRLIATASVNAGTALVYSTRTLDAFRRRHEEGEGDEWCEETPRASAISSFVAPVLRAAPGRVGCRARRVAPTGLIAFLCSHPRSQRSRADR
jgi:hypothetical protein